MSTLNLSRFSQPDCLKAVDPRRLLRFLHPHRAFLASRGCPLPKKVAQPADLNYQEIATTLMAPGNDTPRLLIDDLYFLHEMATDEGMDALLSRTTEAGLALDLGEHPSPMDVALQVCLLDRELLVRTHAEQLIYRPRSFEYYQSKNISHSLNALTEPQRLVGLETDLEQWFASRKRGRDVKVLASINHQAVGYLVRHGEPYRREGCLDKGESASVFYRPERHDVVIYDLQTGELRINASTRQDKATYRQLFGRHLFDDEEHFPGTAKYTLEPLRNDAEAALVCADVPGMEWVRLRELQIFWGGAYNEVEIRRASDLVGALQAHDRSIPAVGRLILATFDVKFVDSRAPRTVKIRPSNIAQYTRDSDGELVDEWLSQRGFVLPATHDS